MANPSFVVYADGASSGNPGPGGWGAVIATPAGHVEELGGADKATTNNRMELMATIRALEWIRERDAQVEIYTDSTYVIRGITEWIWGWRKRGWVTAEGKDVLNVDLWKALSQVVSVHKVDWKYVKGHSGVPGNERVDQIAVAFSKGQWVSLYSGPLLKYDIALYDFPEDTKLPPPRARNQNPPAQPYCYLSLVQNVLERHSSWAECERRVKGRSGARFQKAMTAEDELRILKSWGLSLQDLTKSSTQTSKE